MIMCNGIQFPLITKDTMGTMMLMGQRRVMGIHFPLKCGGAMMLTSIDAQDVITTTWITQL
eukprot:4863411-Karenia_brevis.AAC.1